MPIAGSRTWSGCRTPFYYKSNDGYVRNDGYEKGSILFWRNMPCLEVGLPVEVSTAVSPFLDGLSRIGIGLRIWMETE